MLQVAVWSSNIYENMTEKNKSLSMKKLQSAIKIVSDDLINQLVFIIIIIGRSVCCLQFNQNMFSVVDYCIYKSTNLNPGRVL